MDWSKGKIAMVSCMFHVDIFPFNQSIEVGDDGLNGPKTCGKDSPQKKVHHNPGLELELEFFMALQGVCFSKDLAVNQENEQ